MLIETARRAMLGVKVPMRDGVRLAADVFLPSTDPSGGHPAILMRTPYGKASHVPIVAQHTEAGFAVVIQDVRGRYDSEGDWYPYFNEGPDGFDSVEWVAAQPWCSGAVGTMGGSYGGWVQWAAARERPPHLCAMVSAASCCLFTGEWPWINGVLWVGAIAWQYSVADRVNQDAALTMMHDGASTLPLKRLPERYGREWQPALDWLSHPQPDSYWDSVTLTEDDFAAIDIPVMHLTGWFDGCQLSSHFLYERMVQHSPAADRQHLICGPWDHATNFTTSRCGGVDFGSASMLDHREIRLRWLQDVLNNREPRLAATARVFATGTNRWLELDRFPAREAEPVRLFLRSGGDRHWLDSESPPGDEPADGFRYDPLDPVPTVPSPPTQSFPSLDRTAVHERDDVVVFEAEAQRTALTMAGRPVVEVWLSSDAPDTDVFAEIADRAPDGSRFLVAHGMLRARFRNGMDRQDLLVPGEPARLRFDLTPRAHTFRRGHSLVVAITSSGAPLWSPNPNVGGDILGDDGVQVANNRIHHDPAHPSFVEVPVVAAAVTRQAEGRMRASIAAAAEAGL